MSSNTKQPTVWRNGVVTVSSATLIRNLRSGHVRILRSGHVRRLSAVTVTPKESTVWS